MKPRYFGPADRQLFGIHHPAVGTTLGSHGVLLCYPGVQEYNTSHWAFRRLASLLTRAGFPVFRFDYFGTGDSMGRVEEGTPEIWIENVAEAATELRDVADVRQVSVIGMRFGASLAYLAATQALAFRDLLLWEPVIHGAAYLEELKRWDTTQNVLFMHNTQLRLQRDELLGYECPSAVRNAIAALDLTQAAKPAVARVRVVVGSRSPEHQRLCDRLNGEGIDAAVREVGGSNGQRREKAMLTNEILVAMTEELGHPSTKAAAST
jgi:pimeloyl-ACP methyl ester carboxylesterase